MAKAHTADISEQGKTLWQRLVLRDQHVWRDDPWWCQREPVLVPYLVEAGRIPMVGLPYDGEMSQSSMYGFSCAKKDTKERELPTVFS
jgi:hypothetical protein